MISFLLLPFLSASIHIEPVVNAQTPGLSGASVAIERIGAEQGLSNNSVWAITQDSHGFIWFGTSDGLNMYDGKRCLVYRASADSTGPSNNQVRCLFEDRDDALWVGTDGGLNRFDHATRSFKKYFHDPSNSKSLSNSTVTSVYRDHAGVLWAGTNHGLNRFDDSTGTWTRFLTAPEDSTRAGDNVITAIHEDAQRTLWIGTGSLGAMGGGLCQFDRATGTFSRCRYASRSAPDDWIASISEDASGALWICSDRFGVYRRDHGSKKFTQLSLPYYEGWIAGSVNGLPLNGYAVKNVCEDMSGAHWISTWGSGLYRYDKGTNEFTQYLPNSPGASSLLSPHITTLFLDRAGLLWVGTDGGGVNTVGTKQFLVRTRVGDSLQLPNRVPVLFDDRRGNLWIERMGSGLWRFDPRTRRAVHVRRDIMTNDICQDDKGVIWLAASTGVLKYDPKRNKAEYAWWLPGYGAGDAGRRIIVDSEGFIWLGCQWGVYRIGKNLKEWAHFVIDLHNPKSITGEVTSIVEDRSGGVWIGTVNGLNRFDRKRGSFTRFLHDDRDSLSLPDNFCTGVLEDRRGNLWVSTANGLSRFNQTNATFFRGLDGPVGRIIADHKGRFWFATERTITMFDPTNGRSVTYDASNGVLGGSLLWSSRTVLESGELVFGATSGIVVFHPDSLRLLTSPPPVVITGIRLFNKPMQLRMSPYHTREITFHHDENVFSFEYAALSFDMPESNQYAYMLEGFDKEWVYCGNRQEVTYTNLDPGTYTFRVKGSNHNGVWNEAGASIAVVIQPAYWQTWWFRGMVVLLLVAIGGSAVGYVERSRANRRIEKLERERAMERERARISQDMHDEVGSSLSEISILSELARQKPEESGQRMREISERSGEVIENIGEIIWALNPKNDPVESLVSYIRRYSVHYLELAGIRCTFNVPEQIPSSHLMSAVRRNVFLVVKEALHNIVKHSGASQVAISVRFDGGGMQLKVEDNGKGFVPEKMTDAGNGLDSMRKRMTDIGASFLIESEPGHGTRVELGVTV